MADVVVRRSFIGRVAELARVRAALAATIEGRAGRTLVIGGEAGIGKSRLITRFADEAASSARVVHGACLEVAADSLPYAPFVEILRTLVRETPPGRLPALLGPGRSELTRLLPELAVRAADLEAASRDAVAEPDRGSQARLFELLLGVLERLAAEQPLVVAIEDVQWADRSTRDLVGFLSRALREDPVLLVLTTRTDGAGDAVGNLGFLAELERDDAVERMDVGPFDRDEVAELAASLLGAAPDPAVIDRLVSRTDGNPFYVEELARALGETGAALPRVLRDVLAARVDGLSPATRDILRAAAAAGRRVDDELLAAALGLGRRDLATGLREAIESGILVRVETPDGNAFEFRHALLMEVVAGELFAGERADLDASFAASLQGRLEAGDRRVSAVEVARHWDGAGRPDRALPFMVHAAAAAEAVYAFAEAQRLWERSAELLAEMPVGTEVEGRDLAEAFIRASDCAALVGEHRQAADLVQRALLLIYPSGDRDRIDALENRQRWHLWWSGERAGAMAAVEAALAALPAANPSTARARVLAQLAGVRMLAGDFAASAASATEAIEIGERTGAWGEIALAYGVLGWDLAVLGDVDRGIAEFRKGQAVAETVGSVEGVAIAVANLAALLDRVGRSEAALEAARAGYAVTERYGVARTYGAVLLGHAAKAELALGRWADADRSTSLGLRRGAVDAGAVWLWLNRSRLLIGLGQFDEARSLLDRARATDERLGGTDYRSSLIAAEAELAAWTGDVAAALRAAEEGLGVLGASGAPDPSLAWLAALVLRTLADAGPGTLEREPRARVVAGHIEAVIADIAERPGFTSGDRAQALLLLLRAESDRLAGRSDAERWRDVAERWLRLGRPFQVAYARLREAEAIVASRGERDRATAALVEAAGIAATLGAQPLAERVATFARRARIALPASTAAAAGVTARAGASADRAPTDLTARESEVLRLVAAGWTNQQIADALFITRKTASVHVSNVMGKLGASNRGEAAALGQRLGLVVDAPLPIAHG